MVTIAATGLDADVVAWGDDATVVLHGRPASGRVLTQNESWGDLGARRLLWPDPLERLVARPWPPRFRLDGSTVEANMGVLPELVTVAAHHYEATYDPELDVLTSWTAFIDDEVATRQQMLQLTRVDG